MTTLASLFARAAAGTFPPADGAVELLPQPSERDAGVWAFTAHTVIAADGIDRGWLARELDAEDLGAPLNLPFLPALCAKTGRRTNNIDLLAVAGPLPLDGAPELALEPSDADHPRLRRALRHRDGVRAWTVGGGAGLLTLGRGVAGRWEAAFEVEPGARGRGLGRRLACAARTLVPAGEPVWAQVAPGNAASVRALLAAGFAPVGAEALLVAG